MGIVKMSALGRKRTVALISVGAVVQGGSEVRDLVEAEPHDRVVDDSEDGIADCKRQPDPSHVDAHPAERHQDRLVADQGAAECESAPNPPPVGDCHGPRCA